MTDLQRIKKMKWVRAVRPSNNGELTVVTKPGVLKTRVTYKVSVGRTMEGTPYVTRFARMNKSVVVRLPAYEIWLNANTPYIRLTERPSWGGNYVRPFPSSSTQSTNHWDTWLQPCLGMSYSSQYRKANTPLQRLMIVAEFLQAAKPDGGLTLRSEFAVTMGVAPEEMIIKQ